MLDDSCDTIRSQVLVKFLPKFEVKKRTLGRGTFRTQRKVSIRGVVSITEEALFWTHSALLFASEVFEL